MASIEELQEELVRQSSRRLEAEHDRVRIDELWRGSTKEITSLKSENSNLQKENAALAQRVNDMENEIADLSTSLLDEANQKVSDANRRAAAAHKLVEERDDVIGFQEAQLQALKEMLERNEEERTQDRRAVSARKFARVASNSSGFTSVANSPSLPDSSPIPTSPHRFESIPPDGPRIKAPPLPGELNRDLVLDLDAYASPLRPIMRTDLRDFQEFQTIWGTERDVHPSMFAKLEYPPWRRTKFVQRIIQEDIEPTLRLDKAVHMSWLNSRAFLNGVLDQTLAIEPVSAKERPWAQRPSQPCLLCGETRGDDIYARTFWARPAVDADPLVLDLTCVVKTRLVCEFVAFLRSIARKPPHAEEAAHVRAWRQCNSMREQLFWARAGGLYPEAAEALEAVQSSAREDFDFNPDELINPEEPTNPDGPASGPVNEEKQTAASPQVTKTSESQDVSDEPVVSEPLAGSATKEPISSNASISSRSNQNTKPVNDIDEHKAPAVDTLSISSDDKFEDVINRDPDTIENSEEHSHSKTRSEPNEGDTSVNSAISMPGGWPS